VLRLINYGEPAEAGNNGVFGVINIEIALKDALFRDEIDWLAKFTNSPHRSLNG
jgi:hypothetical protein